MQEQGWASSVEELIDGETSLRAPIRDRQGVAVGAIAISGPTERLCEGRQPRSELVVVRRARARGPFRATSERFRGDAACSIIPVGVRKAA